MIRSQNNMWLLSILITLLCKSFTIGRGALPTSPAPASALVLVNRGSPPPATSRQPAKTSSKSSCSARRTISNSTVMDLRRHGRRKASWNSSIGRWVWRPVKRRRRWLSSCWSSRRIRTMSLRRTSFLCSLGRCQLIGYRGIRKIWVSLLRSCPKWTSFLKAIPFFIFARCSKLAEYVSSSKEMYFTTKRQIPTSSL